MTIKRLRHLPESLHDVGVAAAAGTDYPSAMKEFIDYLLRLSRAGEVPYAVISEEPPRLEDARFRAHLGGMAEHLATSYELEVPSWCGDRSYFLPEPIILGGARSSAQTIAMTPTAFSRRNLFCGPVLANLGLSSER